jgi:hypothetical protein
MFDFGILVSPYGGIILKDINYLICDMGIGHKRSNKMFSFVFWGAILTKGLTIGIALTIILVQFQMWAKT